MPLSRAPGLAGAMLLAAVLLAHAISAEAEQRVIDLAIRGGELPKSQRTVTVRQGDEITLRWTTDRPLTLHVHGYDIEKKLAPGGPTAMPFTARATGRFPIEIHGPDGRHATLGYLEVHPR